MDNKFTIVLFGGSGDLARKKLFPAFVYLVKNGILGKGLTLIGISRKEFSDEKYKEFLLENISEEDKKNSEDLNVKYLSLDINKEGSFEKLKSFVEEIENGNSRNRLFYLSTGFNFFERIVKGVNRVRLNNNYSKIIFEKPYGEDLKSAIGLDKIVNECFNEENFFRIDHYLGKYAVQKIIPLKIENENFESLLNNKFVEKVEIISDENNEIGNRIDFYNKTGAIKDMIQSHLLQVLSLVLMNVKKNMNEEEIHGEKVNILKKIKLMKIENSLLGQYESYKKELEEKNISNSNIETFAKIGLSCDNERWKGVKIFLRTGKKLNRKYFEIRIFLKTGDSIVLQISPEKKIKLLFGKEGKEKFKEILYLNGKNLANENNNDYGSLIGEAILGRHNYFPSSEEIMECWRIVDEIEKVRDKIRFVRYKDFEEPEDKKDLID